MAFQQQPNRPAVQRAVRSAVGSQGLSRRSARSTQEQESDEAQTWVLFSPPTDVTTTSYLTEDEHDEALETPGRSQLSDLGSLNTVARTGSAATAAAAAAAAAERNDEAQSSQLSAAVDESLADDAELDSLDGHLPGFRSFPRNSFVMPVLPAHDGLGSFHLDQPALGLDAQDHIFQFERFNPRRVRRRLNSFDEAQFELEQAQIQETEKRARIEAWRLEHSRIILEEVQREARRSKILQQKRVVSQKPAPKAEEATDTEDMTWHEEDPDTHPEDKEDSEGLITRITRKVLRDILGIDEKLLSVVLGGDLLSDEELSRTPRPSENGHDQEPSASESEESWHMRILETVSRELGLLVNHLSKHPGAFSTYSHVHQVPLPYAGLPAIPEAAGARTSSSGRTAAEKASENLFPEFRPTIRSTPRMTNRPPLRSTASEALLRDVPMDDTFTQEEWERDIDIKLMFRYLVSRFTSRPEPTIPIELTSRPVPAKPQDAAAKAARVRQHHPLTSRIRPNERRAFKATAPSSPVAIRHHSSCASQSTRRSARRSSVSSRHYWDIGGSIGTGSMIAAAAPNAAMGSWGEV